MVLSLLTDTLHSHYYYTVMYFFALVKLNLWLNHPQATVVWSGPAGDETNSFNQYCYIVNYACWYWLENKK